MSSPLTRGHARRNKLLAQLAALVLAGGAIGVASLGVPMPGAGGGEVASVEQVMAERRAERERLAIAVPVDDTPAPARAVDLAAVAERMSMLNDMPADSSGVVVTQGPGAEDLNPAADKTELKYLGSIVEPNRRLALISLNGIQRIVPMGGTASFSTPDGAKVSLRVVGVTNDEMVIERDGVRERLSKADRVSQAVTLVQNVGPQSTAAPNAAQQPTDESEIDRWRREAEERRLRIIDRQRESNGGRERPELDPGQSRFNRNEPQK